ncbi:MULTISPECIES: O-antigen ligase family protein [Bradyrhizobium]|uniref:O-antigen ligase family protein n=1 Tax=Bradyrhizobium TaxID=374 RepID=UPI00131D939F|nr:MULTISPECIES: O-antigen ligase family protein [Bradyrhizobium]UFW47066.1 O-antigen ligase family protein [Bradyrhizobium arachidis]
MKQHLDSTVDLGRQLSAVITAFMLPITTSGTAIALSFLIIFTLLSTSRADWRSTLQHPSATLPLALFGVVAISMLWSPTPFGPGGASHYTKLLLIPVLMAGNFNSRQAMHIACGFAVACTLLLALSLASLSWPSGPWGWFKATGIPVKDNAVQSTCFSLCSFGLAVCSVRLSHANKKPEGICTSLLAILLFADVFVIPLSKTGMLIAGALAVRLLAFIDGWRHRFAIAIPLCLVASLAVTFSDQAQRRVAEIETDLHAMNVSQGSTQASSTTPESKQAKTAPAEKPTMSTASRLDFWEKAIEFVKQAPIIGHGAGSTKSLYASLEADRPSPYGQAVPDPHNQFLAIAIQAGLLGGAVLVVMWTVHLGFFMGQSIPHLFGQAIVLQNVLGSLFNSQLSQVTQGVLYCLAVGLLGSLLRQEQSVRQGPGRSMPAPALECLSNE